MSIGKRAAIALAACLLPLMAARAEDYRKTAFNNIKEHTKEEGSPFRRALKLKLKERKQAVPPKEIPGDIVYEEPALYEDADGLDDVTGEPLGWGPGDCADKKHCPKAGYVVKFKAVTKFRYTSPKEVHDAKGGGKPEWPPLRAEKYEKDAHGNWVPVLNPDGTPVMVDSTQDYKDAMTLAAAAEGKVAWKVDPNDPDDPGQFEFGQEPQEEDVEEEITFTFPPEDQEQGKAFFRQLFAAMQAGDTSFEKAILMGFTYQGPNIDYTVGSKKRACLFGACVTLWDIKAGFALDFGLGLRTPALSRLYGASQMVAGNSYAFSSEIDTSGSNGDWSPAQFAAVGVNAYADRGAAGTDDGNEFVMYFELFAGAKVEIFGANVCPWCQYVEVNKDYSQSFGTPFGPGSRFPLPTLDIPIKDFNFGIVSLTVGVYVTPNITSTDISAVTSTGATLHHASSGAPQTFTVNACIPNEAPAPRYATVSIDEYQYHFNSFTIELGAWMDFSVAGYGAWAPRFSFLTLDLSSALGSLGIYLPDHKSCNWSFVCAPAPAYQGASVQSELLDQSPPSTTLALAGTTGKNGWWTTNVAGTMTPTDNPVGCGAGVASTAWGLSSPPQTSGTSFVLDYEAIRTVYWKSNDKDGNAESANQRVVKIDKTAPTITGKRMTDPNEQDWYRTPVTVHFDATDATSGVAFLTGDTIVATEGTGLSVTGTAEDFAGLTSSLTIGGINLDMTPPLITVGSPTSDPTPGYKNTDVVAFSWGIDASISGLLGTGATLDGLTSVTDGTPIASGSTINFVQLGGGNHELVVTATDKAENVGTASVTFLIDVDIDGLVAAVDYSCQQGWLTKGACSAFTAQVRQAKHAIDSGKTNAARGILLAMNQELHARRGRGIKEEGFKLLYADIQYVLRRYALIGA